MQDVGSLVLEHGVVLGRVEVQEVGVEDGGLPFIEQGRHGDFLELFGKLLPAGNAFLIEQGRVGGESFFQPQVPLGPGGDQGTPPLIGDLLGQQVDVRLGTEGPVGQKLKARRGKTQEGIVVDHRHPEGPGGIGRKLVGVEIQKLADHPGMGVQEIPLVVHDVVPHLHLPRPDRNFVEGGRRQRAGEVLLPVHDGEGLLLLLPFPGDDLPVHGNQVAPGNRHPKGGPGPVLTVSVGGKPSTDVQQVTQLVAHPGGCDAVEAGVLGGEKPAVVFNHQGGGLSRIEPAGELDFQEVLVEVLLKCQQIGILPGWVRSGRFRSGNSRLGRRLGGGAPPPRQERHPFFLPVRAGGDLPLARCP